MVHVLDIVESFHVQGRGLVLVGVWVRSSPEAIHVGNEIELRARSGKSFRTYIKGTEMIRAEPRPDGRIPIGLMVADDPSFAVDLKGAQVWKVEQPS